MQTANFYLAMRQNKDFIDKGMASFDTAEAMNTLNADFANRMESPIEQFKQAKVAFSDTMTELGDAISPMLTPFIHQITEIAQKITAWAKENPELVTTLIKVAAVTGAAMAAFGGIAMTIISIMGPFAMFRYSLQMLRTQFAFLGKDAAVGSWLRKLLPSFAQVRTGAMAVGRAILFIGRAFLLNPIGLAVAAIATAAFLVYRNWDSVKGYAQAKWTQFKSWWAKSSLMEKVMRLSTAPVQIARVLATDFFNWWKGTELGQKTIKIASDAVDYVRNKMQGFVDWWNGLSLKTITASVQQSTVGQWVTQTGRNMFGGGRATGGPVLPGHFYQVNEMGPELLQLANRTYLMMGGAAGHVLPLAANDAPMTERRGNVIPLPGLANRNSSSQVSQTITITINPSAGMDEHAIAEAVARKLRDAQRQAETRHRGRLYD